MEHATGRDSGASEVVLMRSQATYRLDRDTLFLTNATDGHSVEIPLGQLHTRVTYRSADDVSFASVRGPAVVVADGRSRHEFRLTRQQLVGLRDTLVHSFFGEGRKVQVLEERLLRRNARVATFGLGQCQVETARGVRMWQWSAGRHQVYSNRLELPSVGRFLLDDQIFFWLSELIAYHRRAYGRAMAGDVLRLALGWALVVVGGVAAAAMLWIALGLADQAHRAARTPGADAQALATHAVAVGRAWGGLFLFGLACLLACVGAWLLTNERRERLRKARATLEPTGTDAPDAGKRLP
jgi:hypothetical protein